MLFLQKSLPLRCEFIFGPFFCGFSCPLNYRYVLGKGLDAVQFFLVYTNRWFIKFDFEIVPIHIGIRCIIMFHQILFKVNLLKFRKLLQIKLFVSNEETSFPGTFFYCSIKVCFPSITLLVRIIKITNKFTNSTTRIFDGVSSKSSELIFLELAFPRTLMCWTMPELLPNSIKVLHVLIMLSELSDHSCRYRRFNSGDITRLI